MVTMEASVLYEVKFSNAAQLYGYLGLVFIERFYKTAVG